MRTSIDSVKSIDAFLTEKVGTRGVNFEDLIKCLKQAQSAVAAFVAGAPVEGVDQAGGETAGAAGGTSSGGGGAQVSVPGSIRSREDVVQTLERICEFYRESEPSSPVPLILYRAQRMVKMNFMELINELTPDSVTTVKVVTGPQPGETTTG